MLSQFAIAVYNIIQELKVIKEINNVPKNFNFYSFVSSFIYLVYIAT